MKSSLIFDLETNNKEIDKVSQLWCFSYNKDGYKDTITCQDELYIQYIMDVMGMVDTLIGHNIIAYDLPVLAKLVFKCDVEKLYDKYNIIDTLVLSRTLNPDREHPHSLEGWAIKFGGEQKVQQKTWDTWNDNYPIRCASDVRITEKVLDYLQKEIKNNVKVT